MISNYVRIHCLDHNHNLGMLMDRTAYLSRAHTIGIGTWEAA